MIHVLVSMLMWLLFVSLLILRRRREDRSITYAAFTIAVAMTLNVDPVYRTLDGVTGGSNVVTLIADLALMIGVFFLGRGVARASGHQPRAVQFALGRFTLAVALACAVVTFALIDRGSTTTGFMIDLGDQPAAAAYSSIQFLYYGVVLTATAVLAASQLRASSGMQFLPPAFLLAGSSSGVMLSITVITMNLAHIAGRLDLMSVVSAAYSPLYLLTFVFLCLGLSTQPAARALQARSRDRRSRMLVAQLKPIWTAATRVRPGISQNGDVAFRSGEPDTLLHRQVVEIRDALIDTRVSFDLSAHDTLLLEQAERHLLVAGSTASATTGVSPETSNQSRHQQ